MKTRIISILVLVSMLSLLLVSCGDCKHEEMGAWEKLDDAQHQRACTAKKCDYVEKQNHTWNAGTVKANDHSKVTKKCTVCGFEKDFENAAYDPWQEEQDALTYDWTETALTFMLNDSSNNQEMTSGQRAFCAGNTEYTADQSAVIASDLLEAVIARNTAAEKKTNTKITYTYSTGLWGENRNTYVNKINAGTADCPDVFSAYAYDMLGVSLASALANVLDTPYFGFNSEYYDEQENNRGYMWTYMTNNAFSTKKMYLIASDYSTDIIRAFFTSEVDIQLLNTIPSAFEDVNNDGKKDKYDIVDMINNKQWTWSFVSKLSEAIKKPSSAAQGEWTVGTEFNGTFGIITDMASGMACTGICFSSDYSFCQRTEVGGEYVYTYLESAGENYAKQAKELKEVLADRDGIGKAMNKSNGYTVNGEPTAKAVFTSGQALVKISTVIGNLEEDVYRNMWTDRQGYIVTPMPLYNGQQNYRTVAHNLGKLFGISVVSTKFDQAAAYLNYVSTHSTDILNEYFDWTLSMGAAGVFVENVAVLKEMRADFEMLLDKIIDDSLHIVNSYAVKLEVNGKKWGGDYRWHEVLMSGACSNASTDLDNKYNLGENAKIKFEEYAEVKQVLITKLQELFRLTHEEAIKPAD